MAKIVAFYCEFAFDEDKLIRAVKKQHFRLNCNSLIDVLIEFYCTSQKWGIQFQFGENPQQLIPVTLGLHYTLISSPTCTCTSA